MNAFKVVLLLKQYVRNRRLVSPYWESRGSVSLERELTKGYNQKIDLKTRYIDPIFNYAYRDNPDLGNESTLSEDFRTTEITLISRLGRDELWVQNDNERLSLGAIKAPILNLAYTLGVRDVLGGDFQYHKLAVQLIQNLKMGFLGTSRYNILAGRVFGQVPFMLLEGHIGNEGPYYFPVAFNLMNFFEFVSDQWVQLKYQHQFQGSILNKIPLMKKLKWRLVGTANVLWGGIRQENRDINSPLDSSGNPTLKFDALDSRPYVELGYGLENILKIIRVDAFHRLTYLDKPGISDFGVKISFQFIL